MVPILCLENSIKQSILITVPTMGTVRKELAASLVLAAKDDRHTVAIEFCTNRPYEHNLNCIAASVVERGFDWWMTFDDDQSPIACNPLDLVDLDKDVISMPAPFWTGGENGSIPYVWNVFDEVDGGVKAHSPATGLQKVDIIGSGAMLVRRKVLEAIELPFSVDRRFSGPDFAFSRRVRDAGFGLFAHYSYPCHHFVTVDMSEVASWIGGHLTKANNL